MTDKTFLLTGEQGYDLVVAALNLVSGVSGNVHKRCRRDRDAGYAGGNPGVYGPDLVALVDTLEKIAPGMAEGAITSADRSRRETRDDRRRAAALAMRSNPTVVCTRHGNQNCRDCS